MADSSGQLGWSDAQWQKVSDVVTEAFGKASVAGALLPCYGPLPASADTVRDQQLNADFNQSELVSVTDDTTLKLFNLRAKVELSSEQVADESLSSALLAFRRAANGLALSQDQIVFRGYSPSESGVVAGRLGNVLAGSPPKKFKGLTPSGGRYLVQVVVPKQTRSGRRGTSEESGAKGEEIVAQVANAIADLENESHPGPFGCVLDKALFTEAHRPSQGSMVLPADRIVPLLNGPFLRSGEVDDSTGIVVSLGSGAVDLVVATPPKAQFLQQNDEAKYVFRVYIKFVLRLKDVKSPPVRAFKIS